MKQITVIVSLLVVVVSAWAQLDITPQDKTASQDREKFRQFLQRLADFSPDPCGLPHGQEKTWHSADAAIFVGSVSLAQRCFRKREIPR